MFPVVRALFALAIATQQPALAGEDRIDTPGHVAQVMAGGTSLSAFYQPAGPDLSVDLTLQIVGEGDLRSRVLLRDGQQHALIIDGDAGAPMRFVLRRQGDSVLVTVTPAPLRTAHGPTALR